MRKLSLPRSSVKPACTCRFPGLLCAACEAAALRRYDSPPAAIPDELTEAARRLKTCRPALASRVDAALELAVESAV